MASNKGQHHPKGPLRSLRRILSLDTSNSSSFEEERGGYRATAEHDVEGVRRRGPPATAKAVVDSRRRLSWTRESWSEDTEGDEARVKLLRLKSYPPVSHHDNSVVEEKKVPIVEGALSHQDGDVTLRQRMSEASIGRARKPPSLPPLSLRTTQQPPLGPLDPRSPAPQPYTPNPEKKMNELLECAVCLERLRDPRTLPCDHTFCLICLKVQVSSPLGALDGNAGVIKCPTCRRDAPIPRNGGVAAFPTNVYLESLLQVLSDRGLASPPTPQPLLPPMNACSKCGNSGQLHFYICGHCHQVLCNNCLPEHLSDMKEEMLSIQEKIQGVTLRLEEAEKEFSARFQQLRSQVEEEKEHRLEQVGKDSERLLARVGALEEKRLQDGRSLRERLKGALDGCSTEVFEKTATESKVEMLLSVRQTASGLLTEASRWNEQVRFPLTFDRANFRILDPQDEEDEEEADGDKEEEEDDLLEEQGEEWRERGRRGSALNAHREVVGARGGGEEEERRRREGGGVGDGWRRRSASRALPNTHDELSLYYRSRSMTAPRWKWGGSRGSSFSSTGELHRPAGLSVAPWRGGSELYVAASDGGRVSVFARRSGGNGWKYSRTLSAPPPKERMLCPFGVAFSEARGEVYVTDKWCHCIHVYDSEGNWIRRLGKSGHSPGSLSSPEGVAASDNYIFVADTGNDRVQILDAVDGSFVALVGSDLTSFKREKESPEPSPGSGYLMQPTGVALSSDHSKLVICDSGHNRIKIFDVSGLQCGDYNIPNRPTCVFGSLGSQKGQLRSARGVAIDRMGFVIVADSGNARVQIFRPNGTLVRVFGSKGKESGQFGYPTAVHVGPLFELFVSDANNHNVSVF